MIYSNELGKKAQEQVPLLKQKVVILDSSVKILKSRIVDKDDIISNYQQKEEVYNSIIDNHKQIELNQTHSFDLLTSQLKQAKKDYKMQKIKTLLSSLIIGGLGYGIGKAL